MEHKEEGAANQQEGYVGQYECRWCTGTPEIPAPRFTSFLDLVDHLVQHVYMSRHRRKPITTNPNARLARGEPPFAAVPLASHEPKWREKILPERKIFLPFIGYWLEWAFVPIPELNSIEESSLLVADRLVSLMRGLPESFQEQRDYVLKHEERLRDTGMDPKWPRTSGTQARFVAESMAGAQWGLTPSSAREYIRREGKRTATPKGREITIDGKALEEAIFSQPEGHWWDPGEPDADEEVS